MVIASMFLVAAEKGLRWRGDNVWKGDFRQTAACVALRAFLTLLSAKQGSFPATEHRKTEPFVVSVKNPNVVKVPPIRCGRFRNNSSTHAIAGRYAGYPPVCANRSFTHPASTHLLKKLIFFLAGVSIPIPRVCTFFHSFLGCPTTSISSSPTSLGHRGYCCCSMGHCLGRLLGNFEVLTI
jgi:hypothetical protein